MADNHRDKVSFPTRCQHCDATMEAPVACQNCHALYPEAAELDYFRMFSLPRGFAVDPAELHRKYLLISRGAHPDFFGACSEDMSQVAMKVSAEVNEAYATLRDPRKRAEYMLLLAGGKSPSEDKRVSPSLLGEVFLIQEEIEAAKASENAAELAGIKERLNERLEAMTGEIGQLADAAVEEKPEILEALRRQINEARYIENLLEKL